jgi:hypothetical protein
MELQRNNRDQHPKQQEFDQSLLCLFFQFQELLLDRIIQEFQRWNLLQIENRYCCFIQSFLVKFGLEQKEVESIFNKALFIPLLISTGKTL